MLMDRYERSAYHRGNLQSPNICSGLSYSMCPVVGAQHHRQFRCSAFCEGAGHWAPVYCGGHTPSPRTFPNGPADPSIHPFSNAELRSLLYPERAVFMSSWACCNFPYASLQSPLPSSTQAEYSVTASETVDCADCNSCQDDTSCPAACVHSSWALAVAASSTESKTRAKHFLSSIG